MNAQLIKNLKKTVWQDPSYFLAFGFGSGLMPIAPGTWGTLVAIPLYLLIAHLSLFAYFLVVLAFFILGIQICDKVASDLQVHDYKGIVFDEVVGFLVTMFAVPFQWIWIIGGFLLFRLFDIWKPWIIRKVDKNINGGVGIMLDDILAAILACIVLNSFVWLFGS